MSSILSKINIINNSPGHEHGINSKFIFIKFNLNFIKCSLYTILKNEIYLITTSISNNSLYLIVLKEF